MAVQFVDVQFTDGTIQRNIPVENVTIVSSTELSAKPNEKQINSVSSTVSNQNDTQINNPVYKNSFDSLNNELFPNESINKNEGDNA